MRDLQEEGRLLARKRFEKWLAIILQDFKLDELALLMISSDGTIIACESGFDDTVNGKLEGVQEGAKWHSIASGEDAVVVSLRTAAAAASGASAMIAGCDMKFAAAAAPIFASDKHQGYWLCMLVQERHAAVLRLHPVLVRLFAEEWSRSIIARETESLLEMAGSLIGKIDVSEVLTETIAWMAKRFDPHLYDLLLSQDYQLADRPVKPLHIRAPDQDLCSKAFIEGRPAVARRPDHIEIAAPLKGKQGIYGVLYLKLTERDSPSDDIAYVTALSEYAGSAFEIAKQYEHSTKLVIELRTINAITKRLNQSLQLNEILQIADAELLHVFEANYCCILLMDKERRQLVVRASNAQELVNERFDIHYGFSGIILRSREPIIISEYQFDKHVDSKLMQITQAKSLIGAPILIGSETVGAILLVHRRPHYFTFDNFKLLQVITGHIGLVVSNAMLHDEMRKMVITDQLTGLFVRHYLYEQIQLLQKTDDRGSLIVLDLDDFKRINDTFGHRIGDKVLIQVSDIVRRTIRDSDIAARWGGEELAVYLPQLDIDQAGKVAERIRNLIGRETVPHVTISSGIADWRQGDRELGPDHLFHDADQALYEAKNSGKNQIRFSRQAARE